MKNIYNSPAITVVKIQSASIMVGSIFNTNIPDIDVSGGTDENEIIDASARGEMFFSLEDFE